MNSRTIKLKIQLTIIFTLCLVTVTFGQLLNPPQIPKSKNNNIIGSILLTKSIDIDPKLLLKSINDNWGLNAKNILKMKNGFSFDIGKFKVIATNYKKPFSSTLINNSNKENTLWPEIKKLSLKNKAHFEFSMETSMEEFFEANKIFSKVCTILLATQEAISLSCNYNQLLIPKQFYINETLVMKRNVLPLRNWFSINSLTLNEFTNSYTFGLSKFGFNEIEIINSKKDASTNEGIIYNIASFVIEKNVTLNNNEKLNINADKAYLIYLTPGVYSNNQTVKVIVE